MLRRLTTIVVVASMLTAVAGTSAALAQGKPEYGCSEGFQGPADLDAFLALPHTQAALEAGYGTVEAATAAFNVIDHNQDGFICWQQSNGYENAAAPSNHQYTNNFTDDNSSKR